MNAIAFAIVCSAFLIVPRSEEQKLEPADKVLYVLTQLACISGFWYSVFSHS